MQTHHCLSLIQQLQQLPGPRVRGRCDHELVDVLVIALCRLLCGGESFNDMEDVGHAKAGWFKTFLRLRSGIPTHDTFNRVLAALKPEAFLDVFMAWTQTLRTGVAEEIVALDAMGCQKEIAREIKEADADHVLALKGNHGQCHEEIKSHLDDAVARHQEKAPARQEHRAPGLSRNGGKGPRPAGSAALLAEGRTGLVCRTRRMGRPAQRGRGGGRATGG